MATADELYLLHQQSKDFCDKALKDWKKYFKWLQEIRSCAHDAISAYSIILSKPGEKKGKKISQENDEHFNLDTNDEFKKPNLPLKEINRNSNTTESQFKLPVVSADSDTIDCQEKENLNIKKKKPSRAQSKRSEQDSQTNNNEESKTSYEGTQESNEHSFKLPLQSNKEEVEEPRRSNRSTRTKNRAIESCVELKESKVCDAPDSVVPSTNKSNQHECAVLTETVSCVETEDAETISDDANKSDLKIIEEKHMETEPHGRAVRSTRTKKRLADEHLQEDSKKYKKVRESNSDISSISTASDRTENSISEIDEPVVKVLKEPRNNVREQEPPIRITRSKIKPKNTNKEIVPQSTDPINSDSKPLSTDSIKTDSNTGNQVELEPILHRTPEDVCIIKETESPQPASRITRSKVRKPVNKPTTSVKPHSPLVRMASERMGSPIPNKKTFTGGMRPSGNSTSKLMGTKSIFSSGSLLSLHSRKRGPLFSASPQMPSSKILTPLDPNKNIVVGSSFLNKVYPLPPSKEESEEMKNKAIKKRREKEDETLKKKEEMMRLRMENQKKKNEERMRRVQEAREAREKKMAMEREAQENERRVREEKLKMKNEDIRQQLLKKQMEQKDREDQKLLEKKKREEERLMEEKRKEEQMRLLEERRKEEQRRLIEEKRREERRKEEQHRLLEQKRREEAERVKAELKAREMKKLEETRRKLEEERRLIEQRNEAERLRLEKEAYRIAREKREFEELRKKEAERQAAEKKKDVSTVDSSVVLNATYTKEAETSSYDMTPVVIKPPNDNINDYGIDDLDSGDSTDDENVPKKKVPLWAKGRWFQEAVFKQEFYTKYNIDDIFPPKRLFLLVTLDGIFPKRRSRFTKRTSSALWNTPPHKVFN